MPGTLKVAHITDTHLFADARQTMYDMLTAPPFDAILDQLAADPQIDVVVATGDLVHDESEAGYTKFRDRLARLNKPVYVIPGNHDDRAHMDRIFLDSAVQRVPYADLGRWRFVFVDTCVPGQVGGEVGERQTAEIAGYLNAPEQYVVLWLHHHPVPMGSAWLDRIGVADAGRLMRLLDGAPRLRAVVWGHVHQEWDSMHGHLRLLATPSTCAQFKPSSHDFALDERPPGWRILSLGDDGSLETQVHRLG